MWAIVGFFVTPTQSGPVSLPVRKPAQWKKKKKKIIVLHCGLINRGTQESGMGRKKTTIWWRALLNKALNAQDILQYRSGSRGSLTATQLLNSLASKTNPLQHTHTHTLTYTARHFFFYWRRLLLSMFGITLFAPPPKRSPAPLSSLHTRHRLLLFALGVITSSEVGAVMCQVDKNHSLSEVFKQHSL